MATVFRRSAGPINCTKTGITRAAPVRQHLHDTKLGHLVSRILAGPVGEIGQEALVLDRLGPSRYEDLPETGLQLPRPVR